MTKLAPTIMVDVVKTCLKHHEITGVLPRWTFAGHEVNMMPAMHSITIMCVPHYRHTARTIDADMAFPT
jgi:putative alpha-1,2-mannosidase